MSLRTFMTLSVVALMIGGSSVILAGWSLQHKPSRSSDPISGEWDVLFVAMGTTTPGTLELKLNGHKVTGKASSAHTGPGTVRKGSWAANTLSFTLEFAAHDSIALTATLKDGKLVGEFRTEGFVSKWEAKKKAGSITRPASSTPVVDSADPISGDWDASFEGQGTSAPVTLKFKLDGDNVTGTSESPHLGPGTIKNGSWTVNKLSFTLEVAHGSFTATGMLKDGKLVGEWNGSEGMQGRWEAKRK